MVDPISHHSVHRLTEQIQHHGLGHERGDVSKHEQALFDEALNKTEENSQKSPHEVQLNHHASEVDPMSQKTEKTFGHSFMDGIVQATRAIREDVNDVNAQVSKLTKGDLQTADMELTAARFQEILDRSKMSAFYLKAAAKIADKVEKSVQTLMNRSS